MLRRAPATRFSRCVPRIGLKHFCQRSLMRDQLAGRDFPVELLQPFDSMLTIDSHMAIDSRLRDTSQTSSIRIRFAQTDQPQHFHPQLHSRMRILKPLSPQCLLLFIRKRQSSPSCAEHAKNRRFSRRTALEMRFQENAVICELRTSHVFEQCDCANHATLRANNAKISTLPTFAQRPSSQQAPTTMDTPRTLWPLNL